MASSMFYLVSSVVGSFMIKFWKDRQVRTKTGFYPAVHSAHIEVTLYMNSDLEGEKVECRFTPLVFRSLSLVAIILVSGCTVLWKRNKSVTFLIIIIM